MKLTESQKKIDYHCVICGKNVKDYVGKEMNEIEVIGFLHVAECDFYDLLVKLNHPDPLIRAGSMTDELQRRLHYYQALWEGRK